MIAIIAALDSKHTIGLANKLPWQLKADLKHFRKMTKGHPVIMGRKTHESIGRLLPDRKSIIISRNPDYRVEGAEVVSSIEEALASAGKDVFIIGGEQVYVAALPFADKMYLTKVDAALDGDAHFPEFTENEWELVSQEPHQKDADNEYNYTFTVYEKKEESS